ncbi:hypothetical protein OC834_001506 [Tilletia horrida]|uniref:Uncharacterized protein n=1 Tax=Tilletia horrida TaxID=155126 RepID=A0AAN6JK53_9BASI|nr:hypothetical protein OC842_004187 [Tilletia horrida]KAK0535464.1 hypothetical protein OC834_001506 [Tilletia horrida]KAK0565067.1 hypothetical protein OC844_001404 [Tilletia horrida]
MPASPKFTGQLKGKKVVIVGGSSGIGFGVAQAAVEEGAHVIVSSSSQEKVDRAIARLNDAEQQYNADASRVSGHTVNLAGPEAEASLTAFFKQVGSFDHLIYTAGDAPKTLPLKDHTFQTISEAGQVRFIGAILAVKTAVYGGHLQEGGSVVITLGAVYHYPVPDWTIVAGYAGGLSAVVRSLAFELSGRNIRVNGVSPGPVKTEMYQEAPEDFLNKLASSVLTGRLAVPADIAATYLGLLKSPSITGEIINDDSGSYAPKQERR